MKRGRSSAGTAYDLDFYAWTQKTAELVCRSEFGDVDHEHLAEEVAEMGKRDRREVRSRMTVLLMHLLKWQAQPELRESPSWRATIIEQRRQLTLLFEDSPSLYAIAANELQSIYADAVTDAAAETGLSRNTFPNACPYGVAQLLEPEFPG